MQHAIIRPSDYSSAIDTPAALTQHARALTGYFDGVAGTGPQDWYRPGADNSTLLRQLYTDLGRTYPDAGWPLWVVRVWTNRIWQPAFLSVIALHTAAALPDLSQMAQRRQGIHIGGYRLTGEISPVTDEWRAIDTMGRQLRALADTMYAETNTLARLKRIPALRLLTDRMLGLMTSLQRWRPDLTPDDIRARCAHWLAAMKLTGHGDLESIHLDNGHEVLVIARKGCCLDYLIEPGVYCATCPKQPDDVRMARQRADAERA